MNVGKFQRRIYPRYRELFKKLATGQHPTTLFITCSDSRIDPGMITQTDPGELFICRVIGNIIPRYPDSVGGISATIEYAVSVLRVKEVVICGHSDCGVMKAVLNPENLTGLDAVKSWIGHAAQPKPGDTALALTEKNVVEQIGNLLTHPAVKARPELMIHGWIYDIGEGKIFTYDHTKDNFVPTVKVFA
jgi:carbonic anhydrase